MVLQGVSKTVRELNLKQISGGF